MAQGTLITITRDGEVVMKIITDSDNTGAQEVADKIKEKPFLIISSPEVYTFGRNNKFGTGDNLVVMSKASYWWHKGGLPLPPIYRETFSNPEFHPGSEDGKSEHYLLVEL